MYNMICPVVGEVVKQTATDPATTVDPQEYPRDYELPTSDDVIGDENNA